ncbi:hepatic lectin-like [Dreissena polymorpha]|uniref:hepatic lectin-like n=1 Tax=Dreissena polymorpha TaxID=45954 RepID=UPI00226528D6|nr:hepatic lectin-like [Dreissena polymorpha]
MATLLLSVLALTTYVAVGGVNVNCPPHLVKNDNLREYGSSCYEFVLSHFESWYKADADCKSRRGHLVSLNSFPEQTFILNTMQILGYHDDHGVWIGLTDHDGEGNWHWADNTKPVFTNWAPGQPGMLSSNEDCAMLEFKDGTWHDYPCEGFFFFSQKHGWICEYELPSLGK